MDTSRFLAKVIGLYLIIIAIAFVLNMPEFNSILENLITNRPLMFVTGFFTLIIGILLIISHNIWKFNWKIIITLVAWITFLKGALILFYPQFIENITREFIQNNNFAYISLGIDFILGLILCYYGFKKQNY